MKTPTDPDLALIEALGRGETQALGELMARYQDRLRRFIYRHLDDWPAAEDLTQEVFIQVQRAAPRFEARARAAAWLFRIARNLCLNELKRRGRLRRFLDRFRLDRQESARTPSELVEAQEQAQRVRAALNRLPERQRAALLLRVGEGLTYDQIGQVLGLSQDGVASLILRARRGLKRAFERAER